MIDYSNYTERTTATVSERDNDSDDTHHRRNRSSRDRHRDHDVTVYVDYTVDGREFAHEQLSGSGADDYQEGEPLRVTYAPGHPDDVVTPESTEPGANGGAFHAWISLLGAVGVLVLSTSGVLIWRRRQRIRERFLR